MYILLNLKIELENLTVAYEKLNVKSENLDVASLQCRRFHRARANGFNRESAMLKLPKRGGNGASQGERGRGRGERRENACPKTL